MRTHQGEHGSKSPTTVLLAKVHVGRGSVVHPLCEIFGYILDSSTLPFPFMYHDRSPKAPSTINPGLSAQPPASMTQCRVIGHPYSTKCHCSGRASQCSLPLLCATSSLWSKSTAMVEWLVDVHRARCRSSREAWSLSLNPPVGTRSSPITGSTSRTCISSAHLFSCQ
jgi:hypothetical protein